jgi:hypothetical protein
MLVQNVRYVDVKVKNCSFVAADATLKNVRSREEVILQEAMEKWDAES